MRMGILAAALLGVVTASNELRAEAWGFRGTGTGAFQGGPGRVRWDLHSKAGIAWSLPLPPGNATPVVSGDKIFLTAEPDVVVAVSLPTGELLWRRQASMLDALEPAERAGAEARIKAAEAALPDLTRLEGEFATLKRDARRRQVSDARARLDAVTREVEQLRRRVDAASDLIPRPTGDLIGIASASPVVDAKAVYVVFGHGLVVSYDHAGTLRWARRVGPAVRPMKGYGEGAAASPLLVDGVLIVGYGVLQGIDAATGKELWRSDGFADFGTPAAVEWKGEKAVATASGLIVRARDGRKLEDLASPMVYVGPVASPGLLIYAGSSLDEKMASEGGRQIVAYDTKSGQKAWSTKVGPQRQYATPLVHGEHLVLVDAAGLVDVLAISSGKPVARVRTALPSTVLPSPVSGGARVYVTDQNGNVVVLDPARWENIATNVCEEMHATPVPVRDALLLRTSKRLICIR